MSSASIILSIGKRLRPGSRSALVGIGICGPVAFGCGNSPNCSGCGFGGGGPSPLRAFFGLGTEFPVWAGVPLFSRRLRRCLGGTLHRRDESGHTRSVDGGRPGPHGDIISTCSRAVRIRPCDPPLGFRGRSGGVRQVRPEKPPHPALVERLGLMEQREACSSRLRISGSSVLEGHVDPVDLLQPVLDHLRGGTFAELLVAGRADLLVLPAAPRSPAAVLPSPSSSSGPRRVPPHTRSHTRRWRGTGWWQ